MTPIDNDDDFREFDVLCTCGHPRGAHENIGEHYPAICGHADPRPVDAEPSLDGVCMCLDFEGEEPDA